jgi:glutaredoxin
MKKLIFVAIIALGAWHWTNQKAPGFTGQAHERVMMYSLTTCGYCDQKRRELTQARIPFTEYFIDKDRSRQDELTAKLQNAGFSAQRIGTPTFDVHGYMLPNNPSMERIREHLALGRKSS